MAAQHGLYYAPDPSSQIACSIGGNVAENAGGVHCLKYGLTVHNLIRLRFITMDGEILETGGSGLDGPGFDMNALLCGSEGMLAIVTEAELKLLPRPESAGCLLAAFFSIDDAAQAVESIISAGIVPAGLEMMDQLAVKAVEDFAGAGYPRDAAAILLCELDGEAVQVEEELRLVREILDQCSPVSVRLAADESERARMWAGRKSAFPAMGRLAPDYYCMDGTIPRRALSVVLRHIAELSKTYGLPTANVFHAGDGNLHPLILYDAGKSGDLEKTEQFGARILELCVQAGGSVTGEHGVGTEKLDQMCLQFSPSELDQMPAVKHAFDPQSLLNPGKAVPSLHRCAELGAMHVHGGKLPFPELDRF